MRPNINIYWQFVKDKYPDARFSFWFRSGELHFFPDAEAEKSGADPYGCIMENGRLVIKTEY